MGTVSQAVRVYRFGTFAVDVKTGELTSAGRRTPLREQPLQLLLALLEQPGELITREELTSRLWPAGTFVDFDRGLNKAMNHLREALSDSAEHPQFIETCRARGIDSSHRSRRMRRTWSRRRVTCRRAGRESAGGLRCRRPWSR